MDVNKIADNYRLFVDTCSLMYEKAPGFFYSLAPILIEKKKQIIIPHKVAIEIEHLKKSPNPLTRDSALRGATIIKHYIDYALIDIRGEKNDPFADNVFHYVFSKFRTQYDLALLTQDTGLAMDILALKYSQAIQSSKKLLVLKLNWNGSLMAWSDDRRFTSVRNADSLQASAKVQKFRLCSKPHTQKDRILGSRETPDAGDYINAVEFGRVRLGHVIGEGGEAKIFSTNSGNACKIYLKDRLTQQCPDRDLHVKL